MTPPTTGVLLLAYGTPDKPDDVAAYFRHIRGGRQPSPEAIADLQRRYELIGGRTPLLQVTLETARRVQAALDHRAPGAHQVYVAMKHWHPLIEEVVPRMVADGVERVIAIVLAPHYSRMSVGAYRQRVDAALQATGTPPELTFVESWHAQPAFVDLIADRVRAGLATFEREDRDGVCVLFSAHSLPARIRDWGDRYEEEFLESCAAVAGRAELGTWRTAWQSAGHTGEPWLGPDIVEQLETLSREGVRHVLSVPIGFVADHLEVLYDIDHEAARRARELGVVLRRTRMPNAAPEFVAVLDALVTHASGALR